MKLESVLFGSGLKAAFTQLQTTMSAVEYHQIVAKIESGKFADLLYFFEQAGVSDAALVAFFKIFTDDAAAVDAATRAFGKALEDTGHVEDDTALLYTKSAFDIAAATDVFARSIGYSRSLSDNATAQELAALGLSRPLDNSLAITDEILAYITGKGYYETPVATDAINSLALTKLFLDQVTGTDDLDGTATPLDDQEIQFVKARTNAATFSDFVLVVMFKLKSLAENLALTDENFFSFGKLSSDTPSATDAGSLRSHNYSDFTYFSEDYVGASRTFT